MTPRFVLCPYRFSADVPAMTRFLETVGLNKIISTSGDGFTILAGRSGRVAVHGLGDTATGAQAGETQLSFETPDAGTAEAHLSGAGLDAVVWDESYGRHAGVRHPGGGGIWINEEMADFHGYLTHRPAVESQVGVIAVHYSADFAADRDFFAPFGFTPTGPDEHGWQELVAERPREVIGLHAPSGPEGVSRGSVSRGWVGRDSPDSPVGPAALVDLSLQVDEDLEKCVGRLRDAGYVDAQVVSRGGIVNVVVTDPDDRQVEIHSAADR